MMNNGISSTRNRQSMRAFIILCGSLFVGSCCAVLTFLSLVPAVIYVLPKTPVPL
ncbi:MAG TPA: hypothetical protein VM821_04515 [Abditibacteriaceae bacterium]|nr:hypothetical protein [Abditibacteriaceae bacterium]